MMGCQVARRAEAQGKALELHESTQLISLRL